MEYLLYFLKHMCLVLLALHISIAAFASDIDGPSYSDIFLSGYREPADKIWLYSLPLLVGVAAFREDTVNHNQKSVAKEKSLRDSSYIGDLGGQMYPNAFYLFGSWLMNRADQNPDYRSLKAMFWASAMAGLVTQVLKNTVREPRPPDPDFPNERRERVSFPSGHAATAFAFAAVVQEFHGNYWGIPAYMFATFVGASRMNDNQHYLHDVVFGAVLGASYGVGVSHLYKKSKSNVAKHFFYIEPVVEGAKISYQWRF